MRDFEVLAVQHGGELVCWDCMTFSERRFANDKPQRTADEYDDMSVLFAGEAEPNEVCSRCNQVIDGTEYEDEPEEE